MNSINYTFTIEFKLPGVGVVSLLKLLKLLSSAQLKVIKSSASLTGDFSRLFGPLVLLNSGWELRDVSRLHGLTK